MPNAITGFRRKKRKKKMPKTIVDLVEAIFDMYLDEKWAPDQKHAYAYQAVALWFRVKDRARFVQYLDEYCGEAMMQRCFYDIGRYMARQPKP